MTGVFVGLIVISILALGHLSMVGAQSGGGLVIKLSLTPSVVESGSGSHSLGYVQVTNSAGDPIPSPSDIQIQLSSSDPSVASVQTSVVIPKGQEVARFDVTSGVDGETEISALNGGQSSSQKFRVGNVEVVIPEDTELVINLPSNDMRINTEMPMVVFLITNGTVIKVPKDVNVTFDYEKSLLSPKDDVLTIKKDGYYAITTLKTFGKVGNAFIKASVNDLQLNSASSIQISSTEPAALKVNVFPKLIGYSETKIDLFVSLVDNEGLPTRAPNDIKLEIFSNSTRLQDSFDDKIEATPIIKKGEFYYQLGHGFTFLPKKQAVPQGDECLQYQPDRILVGASSHDLGIGTSLLTVSEPLGEDDEKAEDKVVRVFVLPEMPNNATAVMGYQTGVFEKDDDDAEEILERQLEDAENAVEHDQDVVNSASANLSSVQNNPGSSQNQIDTASQALNNANLALAADQAKVDSINEQIDECIVNEHPIDDLDEGAFYPVQTNTIYSTSKIFSNLKLVSNNAQVLAIDNVGGIPTTSSYGTSIIYTGQRPGEATVSAVLEGLGSGSNNTSVVNPLIASSSTIFTPIGDGKIIINPEGYYDLFVVSLDTAGRPTTSKNPVKYIIEPVNEFVEIPSQETFAKMQGYKWPATNQTVSVSATPIGVESESLLKATSDLRLVSASSTTKVMVAFDKIAGVSNTSTVGVVGLIDFYGNPDPAPTDSKVVLNSDKPEILKVPSSVIVPKGSSFVSFPVTTFIKDGTAKISATSGNFLPSNVEITVKPFIPKLKISFEPIASPLVSSNDVNVKIFVDGPSNRPEEGALVNLNTDTNSTATPPSSMTDSTGAANFVLKALKGTSTTLTAVASKTGYPTETKTMTLDVLYVPGLEINWILYVAMGGAVAGVAIVALYFLRKPKELSDEEQEEI